MTVLESEIDINGEEFKKNSEFMTQYVQKIRDVEQAQINTENAYADRAKEKNKILPRARLALLLDPGAPFVELCSIAGFNMLDDKNGQFSGGNIICGIGYVSGRRCVVIVWNFAIKGGTISAVTVKKMLRVQQIIFQQKLPVVSLHESGGGNLAQASAAMDPWAAAGFLDGGVIYCQQAEMSAQGIPQITVAHGNATAGGAYQVALSDYIVLVKNQTQMFLAGPPLLKAATGEIADAESLGGAEMHATIAQNGEYLAEDDADGIRIAREIVAQLPKDPTLELEEVIPPLHDPEELIGIVPCDKKIPYRVHEIIARIADGSDFFEFNPAVDQQTICGHMRIGGKRCAVIGNNGPITPKGALKATQFIYLCEQSQTPMLFLQNTTGFLVGLEVEQAGQVKHGAKMIQAVANMRAPKITVLVGNSYGAGNYAMASRALKPEFVVAWPSSKTAVMGGAQAAKVMEIIAEVKAKRTGEELSVVERQKITGQGKMIEMGLEMISESMFTSARLMDDGLIDPRDTRKIISFFLDTCLESKKRVLQGISFGVPHL